MSNTPDTPKPGGNAFAIGCVLGLVFIGGGVLVVAIGGGLTAMYLTGEKVEVIEPIEPEPVAIPEPVPEPEVVEEAPAVPGADPAAVDAAGAADPAAPVVPAETTATTAAPPTAAPTGTSTPKPAAKPKPKPTTSATPAPTAEPDPEPTPAPSAAPASAPTYVSVALSKSAKRVKGISVILDGKPVGTVPWSGEVALGMHVIKVSKADLNQSCNIAASGTAWTWQLDPEAPKCP